MATRERLLDLLAPTRRLEPGERAAVQEARRAQNLDRATVVVPVVATLEVGILAIVRPRGDGIEGLWRERVFTLYLILLGGMLLIAAVAFAARQAWARRHIGELLTVLILGGGVAILHHSHLVGFATTSYLIAIAVTVVTFRTRLWFTTITHGGALAAVLLSVGSSDQPPLAMQRAVLNGLAVALFGFVLSRSFYRGLVREVGARRDLERLNASLEERVAAQVGEITARAREVDALNHSLRERVRDRSHELGLALARLAATELGQKTLSAGELLGDRFEIERPIGIGGMGVVYAARDRQRGLSVAIKIIRTADGVDALHRFLNEARAAATIDHPAIVRVLHVDVSSDGQLYQALELLDGRTLERVLVDHGQLTEAAVIRLGELVAGGLAAAHALGVVHRDVKPANIMITSAAPGVKVLDFGLAKLRRQPDVHHTAGGVLLGTPGFLAPEQVTSPELITGAADIYALGATLYQALAGQPPFAADSAMKMLHSHLYETPRDLISHASSASPVLCALVMECLTKEPDRRPAAAEVAARLAALAAELDLPPWHELPEIGGDVATRRLRVAGGLLGSTESVTPPELHLPTVRSPATS